MKFINFIFLMLLLCQSVYSQSKKEQIEILIYQKDSLDRVLVKERQLNTDQVKQLETKISKINSDLALIQKELAQSKKDLADSKRELAAKEEEIEGFLVGQVLREDTIRSLREDLHQIKSSNFETFLPYFISQALVGKGFHDFVDTENIGFEVFDNPGVHCGGEIASFNLDLLAHDDYLNLSESWLISQYSSISETDLGKISRLPYFPDQQSDGFCGNASSQDGIYFQEVQSFPKGVIGFDDQNGFPIYSTTPTNLKNLKKIRAEIQFGGQIIKIYYFVEFNERWFLVCVYNCDCST